MEISKLEQSRNWPAIFQLSDAGDATGQWNRERWSVLVRLDLSQERDLCMGKHVQSWNPETAVEADEPGPIEDMPWSGAGAPLVSDRLRKLLERHCPGHAQYLPVQMLYKGKPIKDISQYWIANWRHVVDCFDPVRSDYAQIPDESEEDGVRYSFNKLVVDTNRIPESATICRVHRFENTILVRAWMRRELEAASMTGCQFYDIDQV